MIVLMLPEPLQKLLILRVLYIFQIFGQVKETQSDFKTKIVPIYCNLEEDGLGLDETSIRILQAEVNVFIHSAATLRFDEPLK